MKEKGDRNPDEFCPCSVLITDSLIITIGGGGRKKGRRGRGERNSMIELPSKTVVPIN